MYYVRTSDQSGCCREDSQLKNYMSYTTTQHKTKYVKYYYETARQCCTRTAHSQSFTSLFCPHAHCTTYYTARCRFLASGQPLKFKNLDRIMLGATHPKQFKRNGLRDSYLFNQNIWNFVAPSISKMATNLT